MHLTFKTKKNGHKFLTFYIRPHSAVDSAQWDCGLIYENIGYLQLSTTADSPVDDSLWMVGSIHSQHKQT